MARLTSMRGRYTYKLTWSQIVNLYRLTLPEEEQAGVRPSYNVAPTHVMPIIRPAGNGRELVMAGWVLIPIWLKPENLHRQPDSTINARTETIRTAPTYREPFHMASRTFNIPRSKATSKIAKTRNGTEVRRVSFWLLLDAAPAPDRFSGSAPDGGRHLRGPL